MSQQTTKANDDSGAGLIHQAIPTGAETEPRPSIDGDKIYEDARAFCYGVAKNVAKPFERQQLSDFTVCERQIIDAIAEWMGSRDCEIAQLKANMASALADVRDTLDTLRAWRR